MERCTGPTRPSLCIVGNLMPEELVRLSKRISELGIASRREADAWIEKGWVKVNGEIAVLGMKVRSSDRIQISSKAKAQQDKLVTVVLNKPIGYVSGQAEDGYEPAKVLVTAQNRWEKMTPLYGFILHNWRI